MMTAQIVMLLSMAIPATCLWTAPNVFADEPDCSEAVSTAEMQTCANRQYREADAELNQVYRQLIGQLAASRKAQLKASQQAWLAFRDKNAVFAAGVAQGGSMTSLIEVTELTAMTKARTEQLRTYLKQ